MCPAAGLVQAFHTFEGTLLVPHVPLCCACVCFSEGSASLSIRKLQLSQKQSATTSGREGYIFAASGGRSRKAWRVRAEKFSGQCFKTKRAGPIWEGPQCKIRIKKAKENMKRITGAVTAKP